MTNDRWEEIQEYYENGDPLKDINVTEDELMDYILELKKIMNEEINIIAEKNTNLNESYQSVTELCSKHPNLMEYIKGIESNSREQWVIFQSHKITGYVDTIKYLVSNMKDVPEAQRYNIATEINSLINELKSLKFENI